MTSFSVSNANSAGIWLSLSSVGELGVFILVSVSSTISVPAGLSRVGWDSGNVAVNTSCGNNDSKSNMEVPSVSHAVRDRLKATANGSLEKVKVVLVIIRGNPISTWHVD